MQIVFIIFLLLFIRHPEKQKASLKSQTQEAIKGNYFPQNSKLSHIERAIEIRKVCGTHESD